MRKYITEFGLNVYSSYKTLIPVEHLNEVQDNAKYHIYMILSIPTVFIDANSIEVISSGINCDLKKIVNGQEETIKIRGYDEVDFIDYKSIKANTTYPYKNLILNLEKDELIKLYKKLKEELQIKDTEEEFVENFHIGIEVERMLFWYYKNNGQSLQFEVLYIGQSYGKNGERLAQQRLKSHSTLQSILTDCHSKYLDRRIYILLLEMTPLLNMTFDGISKQYQTSNIQDSEHMKDVLSAEVRMNQIINITEAALINYFKPDYNVNFVENFPSDQHQGYRQYFELDYNCITVELDLSFKLFPNIILHTDNNEVNWRDNCVQYDLFNDLNRKNMYDIFKIDKFTNH